MSPHLTRKPMHLTLILYPLMVPEASLRCTMQLYLRWMGGTSKLLLILQNPAHSSRPLHASAPSGARRQSHVPRGNRTSQAALPSGCICARVPTTRLDPWRHMLALPHLHRPHVPGNPRCAGSCSQNPHVGSTPGPLTCPSLLHEKLLQALRTGPSLTGAVTKRPLRRGPS